MKLPAVLLAGSLLVNAALVAAFALRPALVPPEWRDFFRPGAGIAAEAAAQAQAAATGARRAEAKARSSAAQSAASRAQLWSALHSDDPKTLVARLRAAGFPPDTIRALVGAQIEKQFAARFKELAGFAADAPFWKPEQPGMLLSSKVVEAYNQIARERGQILREVFGDEFFAQIGDGTNATQRRQFGDLPKAKIDLVQRIVDDYAEMQGQIRAGTQGITLPEDREKLALLEREKRADLAAVLTPPELEDYLMRTSPIISRLRSALTIMGATEAEFLAIYQAQLPFADVLYPSGGSFTPFSAETHQQRQAAQKQVADQTKAALGDARYADFYRASNSEFQQLYRLAQRENLPVEAAARAFDLRDSTTQESVRIVENRALDTEQKRAALSALAQTTRTQMLTTLGPVAGAAYGKSATWLTFIERGGAVTISPDGMSTMFRSLPPAGATPPRN